MSENSQKALEELFPPIFKRTKGKVAKISLSSKQFSSGDNKAFLTSKEKAWGVVKRSPEVMMKFGKADVKSFSHLKQVADYIARNGNIQLEDQDGNIYNEKSQYQSLLSAWQEIQGIPETNGIRSQARRFILSMPEGTNINRFEGACREWAKRNLSDFDYLIAFHNSTNDKRTKQPHCHLLIRGISRSGKRLHIDNQQRDAMRESFAACLNEFGIKANATSRWVRGKTEKGLKQAEYHASKRFQSNKDRAKVYAINKKRKNKPFNAALSKQEEIANHLQQNTFIADHPGITQAKIRRKQLHGVVGKAISELSNSSDFDDRQLAQNMRSYYSTLMPVESRQQRELREARNAKATNIRRMQAAKKRLREEER